MKLSLSCRITETSTRKDIAAMPIAKLAPLAAAAGFKGMSMRASAVSVEHSAERQKLVREILDTNGLAVSMVMGNADLAANNTKAPECLRKITPHLNLAERLGTKLVRIMMQTEADLTHAQRAADEAAERGIVLAQQTHWGTLCETVGDCLDIIQKMNRVNFGITFEPSNLLACGDDCGPDSIRRLAPYIVNFYFQNIQLDPNGEHTFLSRHRGPVTLNYVPLDAESGISTRSLIDTLREFDYGGWISVHQPLRNNQTVEEAVNEAARVFLPLVSHDNQHRSSF